MSIITLCGSTKFKKEYLDVQKELTLQGNIVISVGCFGHSDPDPRIIEKKEMLDKIHLKKVEMADFIFVINKGGYIGKSTWKEIRHAQKNNIPVEYMDNGIEKEIGLRKIERTGKTCLVGRRKGLM